MQLNENCLLGVGVNNKNFFSFETNQVENYYMGCSFCSPGYILHTDRKCYNSTEWECPNNTKFDTDLKICEVKYIDITNSTSSETNNNSSNNTTNGSTNTAF